ncbi:LLM class F420-dependent oxidoreductase (plasmid) [Salinigranum rubrum]|uniref:LLM class F420-dependent oxidoreductase n=1 Tax=Salinigranum rubrum TaxID=755307 RepID=A0A2I8VQR1_9EURY|nr:LLM class flavin-dependent oxidoreductase [Salinigranum rubrum]AUV84245.1 LLM class F420-dependent oxidoreductase [Salinigranum rubrum]
MDFGYHNASYRDDGSVRGDLFGATVDRARWLEAEGFDLFTAMDHVWQLPGVGQRDEPFFDAYTALPAVAQATDRIELSALVTCPHWRNPAYLGRAIASLEAISKGRAVLGIGSGWYEDEYDAMNLAFPDTPTRSRQMRETIELCRAMWTQDPPASYRGKYYQLEEFYCAPRPERDIPILIGGGGEQLTLRATAEYADRWNVPDGDPKEYAAKLDVLAGHCDELGTDYDAIEKTIGNWTVLRETTDEAHDAYEELFGLTEDEPTPRSEYRGVVGTPAEAYELLSKFETIGLDTFVAIVPGNDRRTRELFVDEVMPNFA